MAFREIVVSSDPGRECRDAPASRLLPSAVARFSATRWQFHHNVETCLACWGIPSSLILLPVGLSKTGLLGRKQ